MVKNKRNEGEQKRNKRSEKETKENREKMHRSTGTWVGLVPLQGIFGAFRFPMYFMFTKKKKKVYIGYVTVGEFELEDEAVEML